MNKRNLLTIAGTAALGFALVALPGSSAVSQKPDDATIARLQQRISKLEAKLQAELDRRADQKIEFDGSDEAVDPAQTVVVEQDPMRIAVEPNIVVDDQNILIGEDDSSWLGVETHEVTTEKAKELKLLPSAACSWEKSFLTVPRPRQASRKMT